VTGEAIPNLGHQFAWSNDRVEAQSDHLFNFAVGQVRDPSIAEDLVQETFLPHAFVPTCHTGVDHLEIGGAQDIRFEHLANSTAIPIRES
jgi:hypothetical protein